MSKDNPPKTHGYPAPSTGVNAHTVMEVKAGVFKDTCLQLLDDVRDGDVQLIVTKYGEAVARVVRAEGAVPSAFGFMSGTVLESDDIVAPDFDAWGDFQ